MRFDLNGYRTFTLKRVSTSDIQLRPSQYSTGTTGATYPAYSFAEDVDTGMSWFGTNAVALVTNGAAGLVQDSAGRVTIGKQSIIGNSNTLGLHSPNIINPNNSGSEIIGATMTFGGQIDIEQRQPAGAYSDRMDLAIVTNTGYGIGKSEKIRITAGGRLGIGTDTPASELDVNGTVTATSVALPNGWTVTESGGDIYIAVSGSNKMKLHADGTLDVAGDINANATIS